MRLTAALHPGLLFWAVLCLMPRQPASNMLTYLVPGCPVPLGTGELPLICSGTGHTLQ